MSKVYPTSQVGSEEELSSEPYTRIDTGGYWIPYCENCVEEGELS